MTTFDELGQNNGGLSSATDSNVADSYSLGTPRFEYNEGKNSNQIINGQTVQFEPTGVGASTFASQPEMEGCSTYKPIRIHNNNAIDDFYQQLIRQSNTLSVNTFRSDLMQHQAKARADAKRQPQQPVIVNQILPGEEGKFLNTFLKQPFSMPANHGYIESTALAEMELATAAATNQGLPLDADINTSFNHGMFMNPEYNDNSFLNTHPTYMQPNQNNLMRAAQENEFVSNGTGMLAQQPIAEPSVIKHDAPVATNTVERRRKVKRNSKSDISVIANEGSIGSDQKNPRNIVLREGEISKLMDKSNPLVFLMIEIDNQAVGTIIIELFRNIAPKTAENFRQLCSGEHGFGYHMSYFHRIIPGFVCQGGDFEKSDGTGGYSIYGGEFEDENFKLQHDRPYLVSMANCGKNTNGSQFFITLVASPHLDNKHVVFGQVIKGTRAIKEIEKCGTESGEITREVKIVCCGEME